MSEQQTQRLYNPQRNSEDEAMRVAACMSTQSYFLSQQSQLLEEWGQKSLELFKFTGQVFMSSYQLKCQNLTSSKRQQYDHLYSQCIKQFEAYCILNKKVQKNSDNMYYLSKHFNFKNEKRNYFNEWKNYTNKKKYIRNMHQTAQKYNLSRKMRVCLKSWLGITMNSNRIKIKNEVLHQTESEIASVQNGYQKLIRTLEQNLEKKLNELQKEEQQHKILHDKYQAMYTQSKSKKQIIN